jgi:hypothetical protein
VGDTKTFRDRLEACGIDHKLQPITKRAGFQGLRLKPPEKPLDGPHYRTIDADRENYTLSAGER